LLYCHHDPPCDLASILGALGLSQGDLFNKSAPKSGRVGKSRQGPSTFATVDKATSYLQRRLNGSGVSFWTYLDGESREVGAVVRIDLVIDGEDDKTYRPLRRTPTGWEIGDPSGLWPLYRLPTIIHAKDIIIVEGEKCADVLAKFGYIATTSSHGAGSPHKSDWTPLAGKDVVIVPDNDQEGENYAARVVEILGDLVPRPRVKVARLSGLTDGEDAVEWVECLKSPQPNDGPNSGDERVRSQLRAIVSRSPYVEWDTPPDPQSTPGPIATDDDADGPVSDWPAPPDVAAYHGTFGEIVKLIEPETEADPVGILLQLIVGYGNLIGPGPRFWIDGAYQFTNEFLLLVGNTSRGRKGTSWARARPFLETCDPGWLNDRVANGLSSGEGLIAEVRDPPPDGPPIDRRLLVVETEFGTPLRVLQRDGNTLSVVMRVSWDHEKILRTLVKNNPLRATNAHVSIIGHITQSELNRYLSEVEIFNGLGNRILFCCVRRTRLLPMGGNPLPESIGGLGERLRKAAEFARNVEVMKWSPPAEALWRTVYPTLTADKPGRWDTVTARSEAHVIRIAMIYALADMKSEIDVDHLQAALAIAAYADRCARYLFGDRLDDPDAERIREALESAGSEGIKLSDIRREVFGDNVPSARVRQALRTLERCGLVERKERPTDGRTAEVWSIRAQHA
jgi:hypothetical protein